MTVLQIANYSEGVGGIAVQVKQIRDHLVAEGIVCDILSTKGSIINRFAALVRLLFQGRKYDIFHIHACSDRGFFPAIIGVSFGRLLQKRIVLTYHGGGAASFFQRRTVLVRFFLMRTDANIVLSEFVGKVYQKYQIPYTVIPNIIELKEGIYRHRTIIRPRFIGIRSFSEVYNIECTLRGFQKVQLVIPDASLMLLGDGPLREHLEEYVQKHSIRNVLFVGRVCNEDIYNYLDKCDIMVSSSRFDNMPVSVLEGFNAGLLVIASNVGGVPYFIQDGINGLLFDSEDDEELSQKMIYALEYPDEVQRMTIAAHESLEHYRWENCRERLMQLYYGS